MRTCSIDAGGGIELTPAGHALVETCNDVFHRLDEGARALAELRVGARGTVDIAADTTSGIYVVPAALGSFHRSHPGIDVTLHVENRDGVLRRLTERTCDLAVMADPPGAIGVEVAPFMLDRLVAIAAPDHPLRGRRVDQPERRWPRSASCCGRWGRARGRRPSGSSLGRASGSSRRWSSAAPGRSSRPWPPGLASRWSPGGRSTWSCRSAAWPSSTSWACRSSAAGRS